MKKFLNILTTSCLLLFSSFQVLACNSSIKPNPITNSKSDLGNGLYNENSKNDKSSFAIHGLKAINITNLKEQIYNFILAKYNLKNTPISLDDVKNEINIDIFQGSQKITTNIKEFTKYNVLLTAKKDAKHFNGKNKKDNFVIDLTELNLANLKLKNNNFINKTNDQIKNDLYSQIANWYSNQEQFGNDKIKISADILKKDSKITNFKFDSKSNQLNKLNLKYTIASNDLYFNSGGGSISNLNSFSGKNLKNLNLTNIFSADNGSILYSKIYNAIAKIASSKTKTVSWKDIANDKNLILTILDNGKVLANKTTTILNYTHTFTIKISVLNNDIYFLPTSKHCKLTLSKINIANLKYSTTNFNYENASTFKKIWLLSASYLANSYNKMFSQNISASTIINDSNLKIQFYDLTTKSVVKSYADDLNYDHSYQVQVKVSNTDCYFDNNNSSNFFVIVDKLLLNPNNINSKLNLKNIVKLSSGQNLYNQVYSSLVSEYNNYFKGKRSPIIASILENDPNITINITNQTTKNIVSKNDTENNLTFKTNYNVEIIIAQNDKYFQATTLNRIVNVKKVSYIDPSYFKEMIHHTKYNYSTTSELKNQVLQQLANYYNYKLDKNATHITFSNLQNDKNLTIKIANPKTSLLNKPINYNQNLSVYVTTNSSDLYFSAINNFLLYQFTYQKISLNSLDAKNWFANTYLTTKDSVNISSNDVKNWLVQYVNSTKKFQYQLSWSDIAPFANSISITNDKLINAKQHLNNISITINNSPYLTNGTYPLVVKNIIYNISSNAPLVNQTWWFSDLKYYTNPEPTIDNGSWYIATFELARYYNEHFASANLKPNPINRANVQALLQEGDIQFIWYLNGRFAPGNEYMETHDESKPAIYTVYVEVTKYSQDLKNYFGITSNKIEILNFRLIT